MDNWAISQKLGYTFAKHCKSFIRNEIIYGLFGNFSTQIKKMVNLATLH